MTAISQPNHPARLAWFFGTTLLVTGIIGSAVVALSYVIQDQRGHFSQVAGVTYVPDGQLHAPDGLAFVIEVDDAKQFREFTGFAPFVPKRVPRNTDTKPVYVVSTADAEGHRTGRVAFSSKPGAETEGITGPIVVLAQAAGAPAPGTELGQLKRIDDDAARAIVATLACGDLTIDMQLYFGPEAQDGEEPITPYMKTVATQFLAELQGACGN
jgi:hypothetical protein